jgi:acyl-CoA reductase-like NAD-dependent aldehyde dehydrogenase
VNPTVLGDVAPDAPIMNDETFGPVAPVSVVKNFDEALTLANRSRYALGATVYTTDLDESMRAVNELEAGMVWVNAPLLDNDAGPSAAESNPAWAGSSARKVWIPSDTPSCR